MPDLEVSVTICSWNTLEDLRACLRSLEEIQNEARFEVIVIDNASRDGSPDMVEREFPWVRLFRMTQNLGFTGGHNYAIEQRQAPHVFLLNSDTVVHPGAIRQQLDYLAEHPEAGIVAPKLLNPDGSLQYSCRRFPNPLAALFRNTFLGRIFPNNGFTRDYLMKDWDHASIREVDWVSGAAFTVRDSVIEKVGTLDPSYFMYCEDVDWCYRTWKGGFKVVYLPDAVVTHAIGRSTDRIANKMILRFHVSMLRFYVKNIIPNLALPVRPLAYGFAFVGLTARAMLFILKNGLDAVKRRLRSR